MASVVSPVLHSEDLDVLPLDPRYTHPIKPAALAAMDGPLLERTYSDHPAIDWIGRWDDTKTARWAGSSLRFRFDGPLLFLIPGPKTIATESPMVGWQIEGKTYTSHATNGRAIRLWPPEGVAHAMLPVTPSVDEASTSSTTPTPSPATNANANANANASATPTRPTMSGSRQSTSTNLSLSLSNNLQVNDDHEVMHEEPNPTASTFAQSAQVAPPSSISSTSRPSSTSRLIEITLIDWGSVFQVNHLEMLAGSTISPAYPGGKSNLPTLLFIGDSLTSGYLDENMSQNKEEVKEYSGFLDAFPSLLRSYLASGIRVYSIAFPGVSLVDNNDIDKTNNKGGLVDNGMESKFFKIGPLEPDADEEDNDWNFSDREDGNAPTHIFLSLGTNDSAPTEKFLSTLENFLGLLKETYGRRTGDILVMSPFGQYAEAQSGEGRPGVYKSALRPHIKQKIEELSKEWSLANEDPFASGDFPDTPILEYTKAQLDMEQSLNSPVIKDGVRTRTNSRPNSASFVGSLSAQQQQAPALTSTSNSTAGNIPNVNIVKSPSSTSLASIHQVTRPALIVRPSSIAAAVAPNEEKGTKTRLHFIDTEGWLDDEEDTFDGLHPTKKGAKKIAKKLKGWLGENGFLAEA